MRLIFMLVLLAGVALAGVATYMARGYIADYQAALAQERAARQAMVPLVDLYVAARPVRYGESLTAEDVTLMPWPETAVPEGAFHAEDALFPQGTEVVRTVTRAMEANEPILAAKVTAPGEDAGVSSRLAAGMRAFAVRVDVASGVSGFLRPGDRVDVYWTGDFGGSEEVTKLIQANMLLVAVDQSADSDSRGPVVARTITVQATPQEVAALAQAQSTGRLSLSLVGASDSTVAEGVEIDQRELLGIEEEEVVVAEQERVCTIRTRRGNDVVEIPIPCAAE